MIVYDKEDNDYCLYVHNCPSYGKCDPDIEDTPEWYDMFRSPEFAFDKDTGIVTFDTSSHYYHYNGPVEGDQIIIDCDFTDYIKELGDEN